MWATCSQGRTALLEWRAVRSEAPPGRSATRGFSAGGRPTGCTHSSSHDNRQDTPAGKPGEYTKPACVPPVLDRCLPGGYLVSLQSTHVQQTLHRRLTGHSSRELSRCRESTECPHLASVRLLTLNRTPELEACFPVTATSTVFSAPLAVGTEICPRDVATAGAFHRVAMVVDYHSPSRLHQQNTSES